MTQHPAARDDSTVQMAMEDLDSLVTSLGSSTYDDHAAGVAAINRVRRFVGRCRAEGARMKTLADVRAAFRTASRNEVDAAILVAWKTALDLVRAREPVDLSGLGCGDNSCLVSSPSGMATNGGCRCEPRELRRAVMAWRTECGRLTALLADAELRETK